MAERVGFASSRERETHEPLQVISSPKGAHFSTITRLFDQWALYGGEGGIRTHEPLQVTRFPSVRAKPDYATSPFANDIVAARIIPYFLVAHWKLKMIIPD